MQRHQKVLFLYCNILLNFYHPRIGVIMFLVACICLCVCISVYNMKIFESLDVESSFLVYVYIFGDMGHVCKLI